MNPRELVQRTLSFESPQGIPRQIWILPWAELNYPAEVDRLKRDYPDDLVSAPAVYESPLPISGNRYQKGTYVDEWGCRFSNLQDGVIGIVREPLIVNWEDLEKLRTPTETLNLDTETINGFCKNTDKFVLAGSVVRPFERLGFIRTMEQALIDLAIQPPELFELLGRIHELYLREVEAWASTNVDAICLMDDWGTQHGLMISPELWRKIFKPFYKEYAEVAQTQGKYVFMHSDGYITDIIEDLIEVGVHALNSQIFCMGIEELGKRFRGRITFWGEIDRQHLLAYGSRDEVSEAVEEVWQNLYAGGGVIAQCEFGPGARPENVAEVFRAWDELSRAGIEKTEGER